MRNQHFLAVCGVIAALFLLVSCGDGDGDGPTAIAAEGFTNDADGHTSNNDTSAVTDTSTDSGSKVASDTATATDTTAVQETMSASDSGPVSGSDGGVGKDAGAGGGTGTIGIYLKGELAKKAFNDGLSGQTPTDYEIAIAGYHVLKNLGGAPVKCFDHGNKPTIANLAKDNLTGTCKTAAIPTGIYTYGRVRVAWSRYTVKGVLHYAGQVLPGSFSYFRAWSDTTYKGKSYKANTGTVTFKGIVTQEIPWTYPQANAPLGFKYELKGGNFYMTFPYTKPLPIVQQDKGKHWARLHWYVGDAFRWQDKNSVNFAKGKWDVAVPASMSEEVKMYGVSEYKVTSSIDGL